MKDISKANIGAMDKVPRLNLINSCTGYKSTNLIATKSIDGHSNVAIFSSVTHLGSDPALIGLSCDQQQFLEIRIRISKKPAFSASTM